MTRVMPRIAAAFAIASAVFPAQETRPRHAEILPLDWASRDFEGRWYAYSEAVGRTPSARSSWLEALSDLRAYDVIEWIAMTEAGFPGGEILAKANAPNWVRCAAWSASNVDKTPKNDSHGQGAARRLLQSDKSGVVDAWIRVYPFAGPPGIVASDAPPSPDALAAALTQFPPLVPDEVFAGFSPPAIVLDFGTRTRAAPGELYRHQIRRSLAALSFAARLHAEWSPKVIALTQHPDPVVRSDAFLACTMIAPGFMPVWRLLEATRDPKERHEVREAAVMTLSFAFQSPTAWAEVHRIADDPAHPGFKTAVSRLGDLGDEFTLKRLMNTASKPGVAVVLLKGSIDRISERVLADSFKRLLDDDEMRAQLMRAAHLTLTNDPMAVLYVDWMKQKLLSQIPSGYNQQLLERVRDAFVAPAAVEADGISAAGARIPVSADELTGSVRAFAAALLAQAATRHR